MSSTPRIDLVAPPYAGHLFPLLDLARGLAGRGFDRLRVLSTSDAADAVRWSGLPFVSLLPGREAEVNAVANTSGQVGNNPLGLLRQFRANVGLMRDLCDQLEREWVADRPDLVIADYTVPLAGLTAQRLGIRWWTATVSPCLIEGRTGTPACLGGWSPPRNTLDKLRDVVGRAAVRLFKRSFFALLRKELRAVGVCGVYHPDGSEVMYSPERVLAFGMTEFEFPRDWPAAVEFVGPLVASPPVPHTPPTFTPGKRCVLVTLGTHLPWARSRAAELVRRVAANMPDCVFHYALGDPGSTSLDVSGNVHTHGFIPYVGYLPRYAAAITHGGTGVTYACLQAGVPVLVWPHDYDQHDNAARIAHHGLGLHLRPSPERVTEDLRRLLTDPHLRARLLAFQALARRYDPHAQVASALACD